MERKAKIIIVALLVLLLGAAPALAADFSPEIDLPTTVVVEASDDYSAGVFSQLLGPAWTFVAGPNSVFGGIGQYSGLILAILQVFNTVGLAAVAIVVTYQYAMMAVTTAHTGKAGGGTYNTFFTPLRGALGFALCVPVMNGLSLLQIFIIASIGLGINGGNKVWTEAATYVTQHVAAGASTDTQSQVIDAEALEAIQPLFQGVLLQEVLMKTHEGFGNELETLWTKIREYPEPTVASQWRIVYNDGPYVIEHRPLEGEVILWLRPVRTDLGTFGGVRIPAPVAVREGGKIGMGPNPQVYQDAFAVTQIRLNGMIRVAEALRPWARWHIASSAEREEGRVKRPSGDGFTIAEEYRKTVSSAMAAHIEATGSGKRASEKMAAALGQSVAGETPAGGWPGAGVLPTILSYATREADIVNYSGGVKPVIVDATSGTYSDRDIWSRLVAWWGDASFVGDYNTALKQGPRFATQVLLAGRTWSGHDEEGNASSAVNKAITWVFTDGKANNRGILAETMSDFQTKNPISALIDFGERCLTVAGLGMGVSAGAGLASAVPGIGGAIAGMINNPMFIGALSLLALVGILSVFVAPLTPLLIWSKALLGWIMHAILSLFGAPLLCLATVFPEGQGLAGQHARKGYVQLLDIAIRPAVMVGCLCAAYVLLQLWAMLLGALFAKFVNASSGYSTTGVVFQIGMSIMYVVAIYSAIHLLFKQMVLTGPQTIMTWIGGIGMSLGSVEQSAEKDTTIVGGAFSKGAAGAAGVGAGVGSAAQTLRDQKNKDKSQGGGNGGGGGGSSPANMAAKATEEPKDEQK